MRRQAVVLAGGRATRLGPRARDVPKYLVSVAGRPFAHWQLELLARSGIAEAVICIGHLGEAIVDALGDGSAFGIRLAYVADGPESLGTGGALRAALSALAPCFVVTYGDSYLPFDYAGPLADLERHPEALGSLAVYENRGRYDRSNARVEDGHVTLFDKDAEPGSVEHIDYGAMALRREAVASLPPGPSDLAALQARLARDGLLRAFEVAERFYEIGSPGGLAELETLLSARVPLPTEASSGS